MTASQNEHSWLTNNSTSSQEIGQYYDDWADNYNATLAEWDYESPRVAAELIKEHTGGNGPVLDAGCGTGLTGKALRAAGITSITGIDISEKSLTVAAQDAIYERLLPVNMQEAPLPFADNEFAAVQCIGVLTYVPDTDMIMREFSRVVQPGGVVVFTQRDDLFAERNYPDVLKSLEDDGTWQQISISEPQLYLPGNEYFTDQIKVIYCVFRVK
ncbi:MAG: class I SAM-dependent methyltransferase [Chloroflexota bacterium]